MCFGGLAPFYFGVFGGVLMAMVLLVAIWSHGAFIATSDPRQQLSIRRSWVIEVLWIGLLMGSVIIILPG